MKKLLFLLALFCTNVFATPVNINSADAVTIAKSLKGVGQKKADAIVADRAKNGPFKSAEDLKRVKGIGDAIIANNKADILLADTDATKAAASITDTKATPAAPAKAVNLEPVKEAKPATDTKAKK